MTDSRVSKKSNKSTPNKKGIAMVRFMKGSKDEELMKFVRDYLHFHEDYDEDEEDDSIFSRVKLSISTAEDDDPFSQDENKKCFMGKRSNVLRSRKNFLVLTLLIKYRSQLQSQVII